MIGAFFSSAALTIHLDREAPLDDPVIDARVVHILRTLDLLDGQIGRDDHRQS